MRFHIAPLILIAVLTLDVITAHPNMGRHSRATNRKSAPRCQIVKRVTGFFSRLSSRTGRGHKNNDQYVDDDTDESSEQSYNPDQFGKQETTEESSVMDTSEIHDLYNRLDHSSESDQGSSQDVAPSGDKASYANRNQASSADKQLPIVYSSPKYTPYGVMVLCREEKRQYILKRTDNYQYKALLRNEYLMNQRAQQYCPDHVAKVGEEEKVGEFYQFKVQHGNAGDLDELFNEMKRFRAPLDDYRVLFFSMAQAVNCLHSISRKPISHLRLAPENFVLYQNAGRASDSTSEDRIEAIRNGEIRVLLTDFSSALSMRGSDIVTLSSTVPVIDAPEALEEEAVSGRDVPRADVYSLGLIFMHLIDDDGVSKVSMDPDYRKNNQYRDLPPRKKLKFQRGTFPNDLYQLIKAMTHRTPSKRIPMSAVLNDKFFKPVLA